MKFIPIMFQTPLMKAHLEGKKNQTRRSAGLKKINEHPDRWSVDHNWTNPQTEKNLFALMDKSGDNIEVIASPYGKPGDVLWFKETFRETNWLHPSDENYGIVYRASESGMEWEATDESWSWQSSMLMPARSCRMWGEITDIEIQRLQDISEQDAIDEGIECIEFEVEDLCRNPVNAYIVLFEQINGKEFTAKNPWLWVVRYKVSHQAPEGWHDYVKQIRNIK